MIVLRFILVNIKVHSVPILFIFTCIFTFLICCGEIVFNFRAKGLVEKVLLIINRHVLVNGECTAQGSLFQLSNQLFVF